jgi:hypothetical protein
VGVTAKDNRLSIAAFAALARARAVISGDASIPMTFPVGPKRDFPVQSAHSAISFGCEAHLGRCILFNNSLLLIQGFQVSLPIQRAHLDGLVVFVAVAELRGFRAAARQLGVTPSWLVAADSARSPS